MAQCKDRRNPWVNLSFSDIHKKFAQWMSFFAHFAQLLKKKLIPFFDFSLNG
jgi:hypothetical protein